jgi:hypothetical protein
MPSVKPVATVTQQVKIAPKLATKLLSKLKLYGQLKAEEKVNKAARDKVRGEVEDVLGDIGETNIKLQGYSTVLMAQPRRTLSVEKLMAAGVSLDTINDCYVTTTTKPYVKITCPGAREDD